MPRRSRREFDPDDWNSVLGVLEQGFTNFGNLVANGGASLVGTIGNGVIGVYKDAAGDIAYAFDATKSTANDIGHWTEGAAGTVEDFSIDSYSKAKDGLTTAWQVLTSYLLQDLPALGPYDATARDCMKYLIGGSEAAIFGWESSARAIGYTMAFDVGASVQIVGQTSAFSGIYVDRSGLWGFFPESQSSAPPSGGVQAANVFGTFLASDAAVVQYPAYCPSAGQTPSRTPIHAMSTIAALGMRVQGGLRAQPPGRKDGEDAVERCGADEGGPTACGPGLAATEGWPAR